MVFCSDAYSGNDHGKAGSAKRGKKIEAGRGLV